jgi:hypothetical protein
LTYPRSKKADTAAARQTGKRIAAAEPQSVIKVDQLAGGGFSPDCSTVFSVVTVVSPLGVEVVVSVLVEASFEHPVKAPTDTRLASTTSER